MLCIALRAFHGLLQPNFTMTAGIMYSNITDEETESQRV